MNDDEKLKNTETTFSDGVEQNSLTNSLSFEYVNKVFLLESEMLLSIDSYIRPETKKFITDKISKENKILLGIADHDLRIQEKMNNGTQPVIDDNFFSKKSLNINNI